MVRKGRDLKGRQGKVKKENEDEGGNGTVGYCTEGTAKEERKKNDGKSGRKWKLWEEKRGKVETKIVKKVKY